jgi:PAS domain-containing protein
VTDDRGVLVFFNEAAEEVVGQTFAETGEMPLEEWEARFTPQTTGLEDMPLGRRPSGIVLRERRPVHERMRITSADGVDRDISVTAFPLFAHADEFVGVVTIFWRD